MCYSMSALWRVYRAAAADFGELGGPGVSRLRNAGRYDVGVMGVAAYASFRCEEVLACGMYDSITECMASSKHCFEILAVCAGRI